jgi:hypothetical protein
MDLLGKYSMLPAWKDMCHSARYGCKHLHKHAPKHAVSNVGICSSQRSHCDAGVHARWATPGLL